jgi:hypothetical protein
MDEQRRIRCPRHEMSEPHRWSNGSVSQAMLTVLPVGKSAEKSPEDAIVGLPGSQNLIA